MSVLPKTKDRLTHIDDSGAANMVDVGDKAVTKRRAVAVGSISMKPETLQMICEGNAKKGDVIATARLAGIMAAKKTADLIPLCHPLPVNKVAVDLTVDDSLPGIVVSAEVLVTGKTGVEMEALTAASVTLLTIYDMAKAVDRGMIIQAVKLAEKSGGVSGDYEASEAISADKAESAAL